MTIEVRRLDLGNVWLRVLVSALPSAGQGPRIGGQSRHVGPASTTPKLIQSRGSGDAGSQATMLIGTAREIASAFGDDHGVSVRPRTPATPDLVLGAATLDPVTLHRWSRDRAGSLGEILGWTRAQNTANGLLDLLGGWRHHQVRTVLSCGSRTNRRNVRPTRCSTGSVIVTSRVRAGGGLDWLSHTWTCPDNETSSCVSREPRLRSCARSSSE